MLPAPEEPSVTGSPVPCGQLAVGSNTHIAKVANLNFFMTFKMCFQNVSECPVI
jgi:hypothetical protein